jgi:RHS repeat-associated protein
MSINRHCFNLSRPSRVNVAAVSVFNHCRRTYQTAKALPFALAALLCLFVALSSAQAQTVQNTQNTADASLRGGLQVDPSTLGMTLQIPLGAYPGRGGLNIPITLSYGSKQWRIETVQGFPGIAAYHTQSEARYAEHSMSGWTSSLEPPEIEFVGAAQPFDSSSGDALCTVCSDLPPETPYYVNRILVHMPDGSAHELRKSDIPVVGASLTLSGIYNAVDGSRLKYDADTAILYLPDGSRYLLGTSNVKFIDRNGNTLSYNSTSSQWTDTLGRVIGLPPLQNSAAPVDLQYWIPGFDGTNRQVTFRYRTLANARTDPSQALRYRGNKNCPGYPESTVSPSLFTSIPVLDSVCWQGYLFDPVVLYQIVLPNGGTYTLTYNIYGEADKVVLPTGGYERFSYAAVDSISTSAQGNVYGQANRGVVDHWISAKGDGTDEVHWGYAVLSGGTMTRVTGPNGAKSERLLHVGTSSTFYPPHFGFEDPRAGRAYEERTYNSSGTMIRRSLVDWAITTSTLASPFNFTTVGSNPRAVKNVEILLDTGGNALAATTTTSYDNDLNEIETKRYDYVSVNSTTAQTAAIGSFSLGTLLRTEETTYLVNDSEFSSSQTAYRNRHLIALPTKQYVKNGSGVIVAATRMTYDEGGTYARDTYSGTVPGWTDPSANERGNVTTMQRWLNINGASLATYDTTTPSNNTYITTHAKPDQCGSARKVWDANGKVAEITYTDGFSDSVNRNTFAYPTSGLTPIPDTSGYYGSSSAFTSGTVYDFNTGNVVTTTDANSQTITYSYRDDSNVIDPLVRLRKVTLPGSLGETKYDFGDTPGNLYACTRTKQDASTWLDDYTYFDGLGRAWRSGHYEAASSWSVKDTEYDTLGRVKRVSNPYLATNLTGAINPSGVWTTPTYDDLNRTLTVTTPDGAVVTTAYSGNQVTVTDAANKKRSSVTDSLGRLSQVTEDPAGTPLQTSYTYDTLGNLTIVNQGGQYRYFFYDSLSRLMRAKNPEQDAYSSLNLTNPPAYNNSWSLGYSYDSNGNLTARTDARGVVSSYGYDAINRNVWASYSDGVTPGVERHYDALTNGKGRLYYDVNYTNNPATGNPAYSRLVIGGYDALGRVTSQTQGFVANDGTTWKDFATSRSYNLAGQALTQGYPQSGRSVSYTYAASGRLSSAYGNLGGTSYTYADTISYTAAGQITKERFGTTTNLYHNLHYNNRLQLVDIRLGNSSTDEWNWSRGALITYYGSTAVTNWDPFANSTNNNGNVLRQVNYVPLSGGGNVIPQLDDYTYDALNRIASVTEAQQNSSGTWTFGVTSQTYTYDRWGNRTSVTGQTAQSWSTTEAAATNRLKLTSGNVCTGTKVGLCYDAAGNLIFDNQLGSGGDRTYDAEGRIVTAAGGGTNKYVYDADGKRVRRQVGSAQYWQVYGIGGELVAEYQWNGTTATLQKEYGYGGEVSIVAESATTVRWMVTDHLGTPRIIADQTGGLAGITRHDYFPFGEENLLGTQRVGNGYAGGDGVRQKFTGYEHDNETDLDFAEARYCSTKQGRFTSPDPYMGSARRAVPQSWNRYSYVINRPLIYSDPEGLDWYRRKQENGTYQYVWFDGDGPIKGWEHVTIGANGLTLENVQGATGQFAKYNGHNITLYNDPKRWVVDHGVYLPPVPPSLPPIPLSQDAGLRAIILYGHAIKYALEGGPIGGSVDMLTDIAVDMLDGDGSSSDPATAVMAPGIIAPGPYAQESIPATSSKVSAEEQRQINELGEKYGCHTCGDRTPHTKSENWVGDHQDPTKLNPPGKPQRLFPQCLRCSRIQGGTVGKILRALKKLK